MCEFLTLNQKNCLPSENIEKVANDMKVQNRIVVLLYENIRVLQNKLAQKNKIIKSLMLFQSSVFDSLSAGRNDQTLINNNSNNNNLNNCYSTIRKQCMNSSNINTRIKYNKINTLKTYNYRNSNCSSNSKVIAAKKDNIKRCSNSK